MVTAIVMEPAI